MSVSSNERFFNQLRDMSTVHDARSLDSHYESVLLLEYKYLILNI